MVELKTENDFTSVAIIGMAGRFPGAADIDTFWRNLRDGVESISTFTTDDVLSSGVDPALLNDPAYVKSRSVLDGAENFDAPFFGFSPRDAEQTDPQQRVFLEVCWEALENAGYDAERFDGSIGVYAGSSMNTYLLANLMGSRELVQDFVGQYQVGNYNTLIGNDKDYLPTRVSYKLNLKGPSVNVQSACSTSLVAVFQAVQSLINFQCDMAMAGAVSITFPQKRGYLYQEGGMVSPDGHCRPFDADSAGTVFGSGAGIVVLKRLSDAIEAGDTIHAVIRGAAINNDGSAKVSYLAPSVDGQAEVIAMAHEAAGIDAETVSYIEAHGTATPLGDPIEIAGLTKAFRSRGAYRNQFCALGTAKSNIGHLAEASGVAGLIKTVLALKHRQIPPTVHYNAPNPNIDFASSPFYVAGKLTDWARGNVPRRAGVSSFGVGGTNAHVVVEEAPERIAAHPPVREPQLLTLSARTPASLAEAQRKLAAYLDANSGVDLADVAYTLQLGRKEFDCRAPVVARTPSEASATLKETVAAGIEPRKVGANKPSVAFLFPGQGSQHVGMARELYETEPTFRVDIDRCCELLVPHLGLDLRTLLFATGDDAEFATKKLSETQYTQPALFVVEYSLALLWIRWGIEPDSLLGHSIGEYVAAAISGVFALEDALRIVATRARLMQSLLGGGMLAVRASESDVRALLTADLSIAAVNSPSLCVVSGEFAAIDEFENAATAAGKVTRRLHTSHAFHSAMMEPILTKFAEAFAGIELNVPQIPFVSNITGIWITDSQAIDPQYWVAHIRRGVLFAAGVLTLAEEPSRILLEVGPGNALSTLAKATAGRATVVSTFDHVTSEESQLSHMVGSLGKLWTAGCNVDWAAFHQGQTRRRMPLPTYSFERKPYWVVPVNVHTALQTTSQVASRTAASMPQSSTNERTAMPLNNTPPPALPRAERLIPIIAEIVYDLSGTKIDDIPPTTGFLEMGFDSLFLTQATQAFQAKFGVKVTFRNLLDNASSPKDLAEFLDSKLAADKFPAPEPDPVAAHVAAVQVAESHDGPGDDIPGTWSNEIAPQANPTPAQYRQAAPEPTGQPSMVESLISQQLQIMQQQLAVLAAQGFATPPGFPATGPMPTVGTVAQPKPETPSYTSYETIAPEKLAPVAPQPEVKAAAPSEADTPAEPIGAPAAPVKQHGPFKPIERGDTSGLTLRQQAHIEQLIAKTTAKTPSSKAYTAQNRGRLADPRVVSSFKQVWKEMVYPIVANRSAGSKIWDLDGNEYVDATMGFGVNMLGHNPEFIKKAVEAQLATGIEIGPQSPLSGKVAELICEMTGMERVTFTNTGSEAVMAAVRIARTVTGRSKVVYFSGDYHGTHDEVLLRAANLNGRLRTLPIAPGIPVSAASETIILDYGKAESLDIIRELGSELAAVLVEPVQSRNPDLQPREFNQELRKITTEAGAALIFDEVITGFRSHPGGAQAFYGVKADIATYGKVIGGGMPFGVVAGTREYMDAFDGGHWEYGDASFPEVGVTFFAGTFVRHPIAMAAAYAMLTHLKEQGPALQEKLNARVAAFTAELNTHFESVGAPVHIPHFASVFYIHFDHDVKWGSLLWYHLREKNVHIWEGRPAFLSTAHSDEDVAWMTWAFKASVAEMQAAGFLPGRTDNLPAPPPFPVSKTAPVSPTPSSPPPSPVVPPSPVAETSARPAPVAPAPTSPSPAPYAPSDVVVAANGGQQVIELISRPYAEEYVSQAKSPDLKLVDTTKPPTLVISDTPVADVLRRTTMFSPSKPHSPKSNGNGHSYAAVSGGASVATEPVAPSVRTIFPPTPAEPVVAAPLIAPLVIAASATDTAIADDTPRVVVPLTDSQKEVWIAARMSDDASRALDESVALHLRGFFDVEAFASAFDKLVQRHDALRTTFASDGETQSIAARVRIAPRVSDLGAFDIATCDYELERLLTADASQLFDTENGPLFAGHVIRIDERYHVVSITGHHLVFDGWSFGVAVSELAKLYTEEIGGAESKLPTSKSFAEYAREAIENQNSPEHIEAEDYWLDQLQGELPALELPADRPRSLTQSYRGACETLGVPGGLLTSLRDLGKANNCTLLTTTLAAWSILLQKLTGQSDIVIGIPTAGQQLTDNPNLVGHCVNLLPMRFGAGEGKSFHDYLLGTKTSLFDAYDHQDYTFSAVLKKLKVARDLGQSPVVATTFNIDKMPSGIKFGDLDCEITTNPRRFYQFELGINIVEFDKELLIEANYNTDLFDRATIQRWLSHFVSLLEEVTAKPESPVADITGMTESELRTVVVDWNNTFTNYERTKTIAQLFEDQAARNRDSIAASFSEHKITYGELNAYANQLAVQLKAQGVGPNKIVAILIDRSIEMLIGLVAILKAGGAYLPLDPTHPVERLALQLNESAATMIVTQHKYSETFPREDRTVFCLDTDWGLIENNPVVNLESTTLPDGLANVMFTSGSTGKPKGVLVTHRNIARLVKSTNYARFGADEVFLHMAPLAFDASTFEIWGALLNGGRLAILPPTGKTLQEIGETIAQQGVTTVWLTAGLFHSFIDLYPQGLTTVKQLLAGGDVLSVSHVAKALNALPGVTLINGYGPTEGTTFTCCCAITDADTLRGSIPVGPPISNSTVYVLDSRGFPVPVGVDGELFIGGEGVANGYLHDPELTAERFVSNPFSDDPSSRLYRTGDKARWLADGSIEFRGRIDGQIKLRGFRIEPLEIEQSLNAFDSVRESVVIAKEIDGDKRLIAYIVPSEARVDIDVAAIRSALAVKLPSYMVPSAFVTLDAIPLTGNGKPDRKKLPLPSTNSDNAPTPVAPRDEIETQLSALFCKVLGINSVGIQESFWELGGHSLLAVRLVVEIEKQFGKRLPLPSLFSSPTVEQLANVVRGPVSKKDWASLVPIRAAGNRPPLYCIHHVNGVVACYHDLARHIGDDQPIWGLQARGLDGVEQPSDNLQEIATHYMNNILASNPDGPYLLCGLSFGGVVAFEIAQQLLASGRKVDFVGLIDTYAPEYYRSEASNDKDRSLLVRALDQFKTLRKLDSKNKKAFVENKFRSGIKRMKEAQGHEVDQGDVRDFLPDMLMAVKESNQTALEHYHPKHYPGNVVLLRAVERLDRSYNDPLMSWGGLADKIIVREVLGNHYTVIQEPFVQVLAEEMREAIDEALRSA